MKERLLKLAKLLPFLAIPFFALAVNYNISVVKGPFYYDSNSDPTYLYLMSSLRIVRLEPVSFMDHPGSTVQLLGAIVIKTVGAVRGATNITADVVLHPELYLRAIINTLMILNFFAWLLAGVLAFLISQRFLEALLFQLGIFINDSHFFSFLHVSPETFLMALVLSLGLIIYRILHKKDIRHKSKKYMIAFGIVSGMGLVTKLTYIPFLIIPFLIIPGWRKKFGYVLITIGVFLIFFIPAIDKLGFTLNFIIRILTHTGHGGVGDTGFVNSEAFFDNLLIMIQQLPLFCALFISSLIITATAFFKVRWQIIKNLAFRLLIAIQAGIMALIIMAGKSYNSKYMLLATALGGLLVVLGIYVLKTLKLPKWSGTKRGIGQLLALIVMLVLTGIYFSAPNIFLSDYLHGWKEQFAVMLGPHSKAVMLICISTLLSAVIFHYKTFIYKPAFVILIAITILFQLQHLDLSGKISGLNEGRKENEKFVQTFEKYSHDYPVIYANRSSSIISAIKFGTMGNVAEQTLPEAINDMGLFNNEEFYFYDVFDGRFYADWTKETTLQNILKNTKKPVFAVCRNYNLVTSLEDYGFEKFYEGQFETIFVYR